jgi:hypothetical protein
LLVHLPPREALRCPPRLITLMTVQFTGATEYLVLSLGEQILLDRHDRRDGLSGLRAMTGQVSGLFLGL